MCWVIEGATISCCTWTSDGAGNYTSQSWSDVTLKDAEDAAVYDPTGQNISTLTEILPVDYQGIDNYWKASNDGYSSFEAYMYQYQYDHYNVQNHFRFSGECTDCALYLVAGTDYNGDIEAVTLETDWMSAVSGIASTAVLALATVMAF